jgi:hypothetical protein
MSAQGSLDLLDTPQAQQLLEASIPARLAYVARDGSPRVVPTWFRWNGTELVMATFLAARHILRPAARLSALRNRPAVALTIDTEGFPPNILQIRGDVQITEVDGVDPDYALAARRYLNDAGAANYLASIDVPGTRMARIAVRPVGQPH